MTIKELKTFMHEQYLFPVHIQHWVINGGVPSDDVTLETVGADKEEVILYLMLETEAKLPPQQQMLYLNERYKERPRTNSNQHGHNPCVVTSPWGAGQQHPCCQQHMQNPCPMTSPGGAAHQRACCHQHNAGSTCCSCRPNPVSCCGCQCRAACHCQCNHQPGPVMLHATAGHECDQLYQVHNRPIATEPHLKTAYQNYHVPDPAPATSVRPLLNPDPDPPWRQWSCPRCTLANNIDRPGCAACCCDRPESADQLAAMTDLRTGQLIGWPCPKCTLVNEPTRPGCMQCGATRPSEYEVPPDYIPSMTEQMRLQREKEAARSIEQFRQVEDDTARRERRKRYEEHFLLDAMPYVFNPHPFTCPICMEEIAARNGIVIRACGHEICKNCVEQYVATVELPEVKCPLPDCGQLMEDREIQGTCTAATFQRYKELSLRTAETGMRNTFHCKTPDCRGWTIYEDRVSRFKCPVCRRTNCLACDVIHQGQTCREYQDNLRRLATNDEAARLSVEEMENMVATKRAMRCPNCQVIIVKNGGCPNMQCAVCKTPFRWTALPA